MNEKQKTCAHPAARVYNGACQDCGFNVGEPPLPLSLLRLHAVRHGMQLVPIPQVDWSMINPPGVLHWLSTEANAFKNKAAASRELGFHGNARMYDFYAARCLRAIAALEGDQLLPVVSGIPCARCGAACVEFSVPNDIWNKVVRVDGKERDDEYLCTTCWYKMLRIALFAPPPPDWYGMNTPWPLHEVLPELITAAKLLLGKEGYDGHGYEFMRRAQQRAEEILPAIMASYGGGNAPANQEKKDG